VALPVEHSEINQSTKERDIERPHAGMVINITVIYWDSGNVLCLNPEYRRRGLRNDTTDDASCKLFQLSNKR
jgi:hypothetical protein